MEDKKEIKVFVGSAPEQLIPSLVLEYSIKKHTENPVTVTPLYQLDTSHKIPRNANCLPRTPFSFQRFFIPSLTTGRAFYLDSDMLVFDDMAPLLDVDFEGNEGLSAKGMETFDNWSGSNYAMLMLNCDAIQWDMNSIIDMLDNEEITYEELMFEFKHSKIAPLLGENGQWNSLDVYEAGVTKLLHYTNMGTQPWKYTDHHLGSLWEKHLAQALQSGAIDIELVKEHQEKRWIRPFLGKVEGLK
jgi:hypothetical protein